MSDILTQIVKRIDDMPKVSDAPLRLLRAISGEEFGAREIVQIVESDITLTAKCLRIVNSAAYSLPRKISSIQQAVVLLGAQIIVNIALAEAFKSVFNAPLKGYISDPEEFWKHSTRCALGAKIIARELRRDVHPDLAYTAGLLHDIGKAIISEFLEEYQQDLMVEMNQTEDKDFLAIEQKLLGTDHTRVGAKMAEKWKFPEVLIQSIRYHHHLGEAKKEHLPLVAIVHVADLLAMMSGHGTGMDSLAYAIDPRATALLNITEERLPKIIFEIDVEYLSIQNRLNNMGGNKNE